MKAEFENLIVHKNENHKRFELNVNGPLAFIDYKESPEHIALTHTEVEPELQGTGASTAVVEKTLMYIKETGKKLLPFCPFVFAYIKRHPEWKTIVDPLFEGYANL